MLNTQQQEFFNLVVNSEKGSKFVLEGDAGVGKTYTVSTIANYFVEKEMSVVCITPTHAAKKVLSGLLDDRIEVTTIAKALNFRPALNKFKEISFHSPTGLDYLDADLLIVDEKGMVPDHQVKLINKFQGIIIYTGDDKQLRPVKGKQSVFKDCQKFKLTIQMRSSSDIEKIAKSVLESEELVFPESDIETRCQLIQEFIETDDIDNSLYLCYRNELADTVNERIRQSVYGQDAETFVPGEKLLARFTKFNITNNQVFTIVDCVELDEDNWMIETEEGGLITTKSPKAMREFKHYLEEQKERALKFLKQGNQEAHDAIINEVFSQLEEILEVNYPYASTIHKAQGRSIDNVFVDTLDILKGRDRKRLLYVAFSRAKKVLKTIKIKLDRLSVIQKVFKDLRAKYKTTKLVCRKEYAMFTRQQLVSFLKEKLNIKYSPLTKSQLDYIFS